MTTNVLAEPIATWVDRWSGKPGGAVVLDLGSQPPSDLFPAADDPLPDPAYPLRMVMSKVSGLLQLEDDPTEPEEVMGVEPVALVRQAELCVSDAADAGYVREGTTVVEYPSPHGGSWGGQLTARGAVLVDAGPVDLVVDVHGMMHDRDQNVAFVERRDLLAPDGVLVMMIHDVASIVRLGMWNALKSGHFAYYSVPALVSMAREIGMVSIGAWQYPLYGDRGTTLIAFARSGSRWGEQAQVVTDLVESQTAEGIVDPQRVASLSQTLTASVAAIRSYLDQAKAAGLTVAGYGAASRTSALLVSAKVTTDDLVGIADAAAGKHGRTMPGNRIPIWSPAHLVESRPDRVFLFVPDLLPEVRATYPEIEANGGRWVVMDPTPREV
ncbi:MAG: methyltransferase C-terminal domain-containing protein [Micrococcales bacterium]|nr:methyltransferase C-terminal domain-containing protein [Micrococcales bacterium]MCL2667102.1 methyltransferase C-terminal domain-containing protein [Micrococcales bacterium]